MAKKSFKGGLGDLLKDSIRTGKEIDNVENVDSEKVEFLESQITLLKEELRKWRTGKLTLENFHETLTEHGLKYNSVNNEFEKIRI